MGLKFVEKGDVIVKKKDYETLQKYAFAAKNSADNAIAVIENAMGPSKGSQFQDGLMCQSMKDSQKTVRFLDVLCNVLDRVS